MKKELAPPYDVVLSEDEDGVQLLRVLVPDDAPPVDPGPEPGPDPGVNWPPAPITDLPGTCSVEQLQSAINACPGGGSVRIGAGNIDFQRRSVQLKANVCVHADGKVVIVNGPGAGSIGAFNGGGLSGWKLTGKGPDSQGFEFAGSLVNASHAQNWLISCADFHSVAENGFDGSAIRISSSSYGVIVNCDFWNCGGNVVGMYDMTNITFDGNHFANCMQPYSIQEPTSGNRSLGIDLRWYRNVFEKTGRACIEVGPASNGAEYFKGLRVQGCWFADFDNQGDVDAMLPISLVGQAAEDTIIEDNWIDRGMGPNAIGKAICGIEISGTGVARRNTMVNFAWAGFTYQAGWVIEADNTWWVDPGQPAYGPDHAGGWINNGSGNGSFHDSGRAPSKPATPPKPARIAAGTYYTTPLRAHSRREPFGGGGRHR